MNRSIACVVCALLLAMSSGCQTSTSNPAFPVTVDAAKAHLREMGEQPRRLDRPVVVVSGWMDPGFATHSLVKDLKQATGDERVLGVTVGLCPTFDACRAKLLEAVVAAYPGDARATAEVDVVAYSMGGLVSRLAAIPQDDGQPALRIARLFTIATPHRGASLARLAIVGSRETRMKPGSAFLEHLATAEPVAPYTLLPYARLGDLMVGEQHAAPPGMLSWWVPNRPLEDAHLSAYRDPRIVADIARRLRGETPLTCEPRTPLPE